MAKKQNALLKKEGHFKPTNQYKFSGRKLIVQI
jgi:hypothetical protein